MRIMSAALLGRVVGFAVLAAAMSVATLVPGAGVLAAAEPPQRAAIVKRLSAGTGATIDLDIPFPKGNGGLGPPAKPYLDELAAALTSPALATLAIEIAGHTEAGGNRDVALTLSRKRAEVVVEALVARGVAADRLQAIGYGDTRLRRPDRPSWADNRRIEVIVRIPAASLTPPSPPAAEPAPAAAPLPPSLPAPPPLPFPPTSAPLSTTPDSPPGLPSATQTEPPSDDPPRAKAPRAGETVLAAAEPESAAPSPNPAQSATQAPAPMAAAPTAAAAPPEPAAPASVPAQPAATEAAPPAAPMAPAVPVSPPAVAPPSAAPPLPVPALTSGAATTGTAGSGEPPRRTEPPAAPKSSRSLAELEAEIARLHSERRYAEAIPLAQQVLEREERTRGGPDRPEVAAALTSLAMLYHDQGDYQSAEPFYRRGLETLQRAFGETHLEVAVGLGNLADLLIDQERLEEAVPFHVRALAIREGILGTIHPKVAVSLNKLGRLYHRLDRLNEAEPLLRRALTIRELALVPSDPNIAISQTNLAMLLTALGRVAEAEFQLKRCAEFWERTKGESDPGLATALSNLAMLYQRTPARRGDAEANLRRALEIREAAFGPDHPMVAESLASLASILHDLGRDAEAAPLLERSRSIREREEKEEAAKR